VILYWVISTALRSNGALGEGGPGKRHLRGARRASKDDWIFDKLAGEEPLGNSGHPSQFSA